MIRPPCSTSCSISTRRAAMRSVADRPRVGTTVTWSVTVEPPVAGNARWNAGLLEAARAELARRLPEEPDARELTLELSLLTVRLRREAGAWQPGAELRLVYREAGLPAGSGSDQDGRGNLPSVALPDEA